MPNRQIEHTVFLRARGSAMGIDQLVRDSIPGFDAAQGIDYRHGRHVSRAPGVPVSSGSGMTHPPLTKPEPPGYTVPCAYDTRKTFAAPATIFRPSW
ncbi:hypothetical protein MTO96_031078 [Rhipicephalus appendiculatus]